MQVKIQRVDEKQAARWLDGMGRNRKLSPTRVELYKNAMMNGEWEANGATIVFNGTGKLMNGQHRLEGHVAAAEEMNKRLVLPYIVVRGVESKAFDTIDDLPPRRGKDVLHIRGVKNSSRVAAAIYTLHQLDRLEGKVGFGGVSLSKGLTNKEVLHKYASNKGIAKSADFFEELDYTHGLFPPGAAIALHYQFSKLNEVMANKFVTQVMTGEGLKAGSIEMMLRNKLLKERAKRSSGQMSKTAKMGLFITAWNAKRGKQGLVHHPSGDQLRFRWSIDRFPEVQ
jgi:hypothetical protein